MGKSRASARRSKGTPRRYRRGPSQTPGPTSRPGDPKLWDVARRTVATAEELVGLETPHQAEYWLSSLVSAWEGLDLGGDNPEKVVGLAVVAAAAAERSARALALLKGVAIFGGELAGPQAHAETRRLAELNLELPTWVDALGAAQVKGSWKTVEAFGDSEIVTLELEHRGYPPQAIAVLIDHNFGSMAKDIFVTKAEGFRSRWEDDARDVTVADIDLQEAADTLAHGLEMEQMLSDSPYSESLGRLRPLLRTYLKTLPPARPVEHPTFTQNERDRLAAEFASSPEASSLDAVVVDDLAWRMIDFGCDYSDGDPLRWSPVVVELFMAGWLPRKALLEVPVEAVPDALRAWVRFAGRKRGLSELLIDEAAAAVEQWTPEFKHAINDPSRFGPSKAMFGAMLDEGIDITDKAAVDAWVKAFNARPQEERRKVLR